MEAYESKCQADARLAILAELAAQSDATLNSQSMMRMLDAIGIKRSRDWIETQLRRLAELEAVKLRVVSLPGIGGVIVAELTCTGRDHVDRRALLAGVTAPADVA